MDDAELAAAHRDAASAWPGVLVTPQELRARLDEVGAADPGLREQYLVTACLRGDPMAITAFERHAFDQVRLVAARFIGVLTADELEQRVREKLFVDDGRGRSSLRSFSGAADLRTWVRVIATRLALDARQSEARRARRHEQLPQALPDRDPELGWMRSLYTEEFRAVLDVRIAALSPRDRNLLRAQVVHGMRLADIAQMYRVHRATASRWLQDARESLMQGVRDDLTARLGLGPDEVESVMRMIRSDVPGSAVTRGLARSLGGEPSPA